LPQSRLAGQHSYDPWQAWQKVKLEQVKAVEFEAA
jgi:hypothetical protein